MTKKEFDLLQRLATRGLSDGTGMGLAARDVLVGGADVGEAAIKRGCNKSHVTRKIKRLNELRADILSVYYPQ